MAAALQMLTSEGKTHQQASIPRVWVKQVWNRETARVQCCAAETVFHSVLGRGPRVCTKKAATQQGWEGQAFLDELKSIFFPVRVVFWFTATTNLKIVTLRRKISPSMWEQLWAKHQAKLLVIKQSCCLQTWSHTTPDWGRKWHTHKQTKNSSKI